MMLWGIRTPAQLMDKYKLNNEAIVQLLKGNSKENSFEFN
jgi:hypothetical protein